MVSFQKQSELILLSRHCEALFWVFFHLTNNKMGQLTKCVSLLFMKTRNADFVQ